jgi:hypothetical protein
MIAYVCSILGKGLTEPRKNNSETSDGLWWDRSIALASTLAIVRNSEHACPHTDLQDTVSVVKQFIERTNSLNFNLITLSASDAADQV